MSGLAPSSILSPSSTGDGSIIVGTGDLLDPVTEKGRLRVDISATAGTLVSVLRIHPSGRRIPVRGMQLQPLSGGAFVGWDYEMPIGVPVVYEASLYDASDTLNPLSVVDSGTITFTTQHEWLKDPLEPIRNIPVLVNDMSTYTYQTPVTILPVLGRPDPVTVGDVRQAASGQVSFYTNTEADRDLFHIITASGHALLLQSTQASGVGNMYVAFTEVDEQRISPLRDEQGRVWVCTYQEVGIPQGDAAAFVTYNDLLNSQSSYQSTVDQWNSYLEMIEGLDSTSPRPDTTWRGA